MTPFSMTARNLYLLLKMAPVVNASESRKYWDDLQEVMKIDPRVKWVVTERFGESTIRINNPNDDELTWATDTMTKSVPYSLPDLFTLLSDEIKIEEKTVTTKYEKYTHTTVTSATLTRIPIEKFVNYVNSVSGTAPDSFRADKSFTYTQGDLTLIADISDNSVQVTLIARDDD